MCLLEKRMFGTLGIVNSQSLHIFTLEEHFNLRYLLISWQSQETFIFCYNCIKAVPYKKLEWWYLHSTFWTTPSGSYCSIAFSRPTQGTESSDLSLISDFFPTHRTILEISVNLKRIFLRGWGYGYWGKMTQKYIGVHHLQPLNPKRPPCKRPNLSAFL